MPAKGTGLTAVATVRDRFVHLLTEDKQTICSCVHMLLCNGSKLVLAASILIQFNSSGIGKHAPTFKGSSYNEGMLSKNRSNTFKFKIQ